MVQKHMSAKEIQNTIIFQHLIKKKFDQDSLMCREVIGTFLAQQVGMTDQKMVTSLDSLMMEKVNGVSLTSLGDQASEELEEMLMQKLASKLLEVKNKYLSKRKEINCFLGDFGFETLVLKNREIVLRYFGEGLYKRIISISSDMYTICHGDLNLSNLMIVGSDLILVDFEHVVEAPIEFDLACSAFFDDFKSLNITTVVKSLSRLDQVIDADTLTLMIKLYFADQMRKAEPEKQKLLIKIAKGKKII